MEFRKQFYYRTERGSRPVIHGQLVYHLCGGSIVGAREVGLLLRLPHHLALSADGFI